MQVNNPLPVLYGVEPGVFVLFGHLIAGLLLAVRESISACSRSTEPAHLSLMSLVIKGHSSSATMRCRAIGCLRSLSTHSTPHSRGASASGTLAMQQLLYGRNRAGTQNFKQYTQRILPCWTQQRLLCMQDALALGVACAQHLPQQKHKQQLPQVNVVFSVSESILVYHVLHVFL